MHASIIFTISIIGKIQYSFIGQSLLGFLLASDRKNNLGTKHVEVLCVYVGVGCYYFRVVITQAYSHSLGHLYKKEHNQLNGGSLINHSGMSAEYKS